MSQFVKIVTGLVIVAVLALGFGLGFVAWHGLATEQRTEVFIIVGGGILAMWVLLLAGHAFGIKGDGYYITVGGLVFLGVDFILWQRLGLMPSVKFSRGGFIPAGILGVFLGPLYRIIAVPVRTVVDLR